MGLVTPSQSNPGDEITASKINDPINQLAAVINGGIDDSNIASLSGSKVANSSVTSEKLAPSVTTESAGGFTYKVYNYGSHKVYIGRRSFSSFSSGTQYGPWALPTGLNYGTNCFGFVTAAASSGGYSGYEALAFNIDPGLGISVFAGANSNAAGHFIAVWYTF